MRGEWLVVLGAGEKDHERGEGVVVAVPQEAVGQGLGKRSVGTLASREPPSVWWQVM